MGFNYVLLRTLYVNEENALFCITVALLGKDQQTDGWGLGVGDGCDTSSSPWVTQTNPCGLHFPVQEARDQRMEQPSAYFVPLLLRRTELRGMKQSYSCEMAIALEVNGQFFSPSECPEVLFASSGELKLWKVRHCLSFLNKDLVFSLLWSSIPAYS